MKHKYVAVLKGAFDQEIKVGEITGFIKKNRGLNYVIEKFYDP
jgi:hypothetical protein